MERIRKGDQRATGILVRRYLEQAMAYAGRFAGNNPDHESEDLVSEAFIKTIRAIEIGTSVNQVFPYLRKCIYNQHLDDLRRRRPPTSYFDDLGVIAADSYHYNTTDDHDAVLMELILNEVAGMREDQQIIFELRVFDRRDFEYIAREMRTCVDTVTHIYYNVIRTLKNRAPKLYDSYVTDV
ncbi:MAG: sigma-70 family RNA polymerase sigma factor [Bacteroidota bacterium]